MYCLDTLFPTPTISWVLYPNDEDRVAARTSRLPTPQHAPSKQDGFAKALGYRDWTALWDAIALSPSGLGIGPQSWTQTLDTGSHTLESLVDPLNPWEDRIKAWTQWHTALKTRNSLALCIPDISLLSFIDPARLVYTDRNTILSNTNGLWWTTLSLEEDGPTIGPSVFLSFDNPESITRHIDTAGLVVCWTISETRALKRYGMGRHDPRITPLTSIPTQTAWHQAQRLKTQPLTHSEHFSDRGLATLGHLTLHTLETAP